MMFPEVEQCKCKFCNKEIEDINTAKIVDGEAICKSCATSYENGKCWLCGEPSKSLSSDTGLCNSCNQIKLFETMNDSFDPSLSESELTGLTINDTDYKKLIFESHSFNKDDIRSSKEMRRLWLIVKFKEIDASDKDIIDNINKAEQLLIDNLDVLFGTRCKLLLKNNSVDKSIICGDNNLGFVKIY